MSRAVVSNVQVLTAGTLYDQEQSKDGKAIPSTVVTLMVTPEDAERITLAQSSGSIMLALRNPLDIAPTDTKGVRLASLMGAPDDPPVVKVAERPARVVRAGSRRGGGARSPEVLQHRGHPGREAQRRGRQVMKESSSNGATAVRRR